MSKFGSLYVEKDSIFHRMNPVVKTLMFILWSITVFMYVYEHPNKFVLSSSDLYCYTYLNPISNNKELVFFAVIVFNIINAVFILIIPHEFGIKLAGHKPVLVGLFGATFTPNR